MSDLVWKYRVVAVGGTFDYIHRGHQALLAKAFEMGEVVVVGVVRDEFAVKLGKVMNHDYNLRVTKLRHYLHKNYPKRKYETHPLSDYYGPSVTEARVEALVVSEETEHRVKGANRLRSERGLKPLDKIVVNMVLADDGTRISSTRVRTGIIDTQGRIMKKEA